MEHGDSISWPLRSLNVTSYDVRLHLLGAIEEIVYTRKTVRNFYELREIVQDTVASVTPEKVERTWEYVKHHHLRPALRRKQRHLVVQNPIILHDNARSHTAAAVKDLLRRWKCEILEYPSYSPDINPCDYDLFAKVKEPL
ncbi:hypothetical protein ANN_13972 [Periplaneta americana]|uniref:Tc1-like transposase DDE domain-containing protein n=1 Tax=Periplaneta americana TaxID=6978 RepID=A0ABQ8SW11_PERAM|nr:hypothetical protein ANN_13972 [Periplaneta americana]